MTRMVDAGLAPDVVSLSAVINACGQAGDTERASNVFETILARGLRPTIVTYTSLARPHSRNGDFQKVEQIYKRMRKDGIRTNEYFLNVQLSAYTHATPPQGDKAEKALREALSQNRGIKLNDYILTSLERCVGEERYAVLKEELDLRSHLSAPRRAKAPSALPPWRAEQ